MVCFKTTHTYTYTHTHTHTHTDKHRRVNYKQCPKISKLKHAFILPPHVISLDCQRTFSFKKKHNWAIKFKTDKWISKSKKMTLDPYQLSIRPREDKKGN